MNESAVYVAPAVAAVRSLWDRSGSRAGPVIGEQLSAFADALIDAHAAGEPAAAVLVSNWLEARAGAPRIGAPTMGCPRTDLCPRDTRA